MDSGAVHDEIGGVDDEGFIPLATLRGIATVVGREKFVARYPVPALLFRAIAEKRDAPPSPEPELPVSERERSFQRTLLLPLAPDGARRYHDRVAFLAKRPGTMFPKLISIGRAMNSDLRVGLETISKFHGFFMLQGGRWIFTDARPTVGTRRNGEPIAPGAKLELEDGDELELGLEIAVTLLTPTSLWERVRK